MRAIDLYAGIGGWSLGLRLAGVDVVASYEWWQPAIDTHNGNHGGALQPVDIRGLQLADLPTDIDIVVGSPPCTEFSYSNRGGSGDIAEGLKDIVKFFEVVEHLKPRFWAMENVPRVAEVLEQGFRKEGHALHRFRHLDPHIEVVDFSEYGTPQARRRCIATNIPFSLIKAYKDRVPRRTLGDVIAALAAAEDVVDPVWGTILPAAKLTEMEVEPVLNSEELRMNREAKEFHPVYNNMAFPDPLDEPARTVTATCTRVSRESIVIADPVRRASFRRLTVRERACLQGFPITYQFYARSFSEKAKMVGNAIPPTFTYLLALAANGVDADAFDGFTSVADQLELPAKAAPVTAADGEGRSYPERRSFRAALPHLRFKSGMRFDLSNEFTAGGDVSWRVRFYFGSSKDIREIELDGTIER
ncbi:MAG: DNA cytosine methyltransferase, partial [Caulobacteraceae bacterium]